MLKQKIINYCRQDFNTQQLFLTLIAGLTTGILTTTFSTSLGALIFSGDLSSYRSLGISMALVTTITVGLVITFFSSYCPMQGSVQDIPAVILVSVISSIKANMPPGMSDREQFLTIMAAIALIVFLTGITGLVLGQLKLGQFIRIIPYPVIAGFLAGTGCLIFVWSFSILTDIPLSLAQVPLLLHPDVILHWLSGLLFAVTLLILTSRYKHWFIFPASILTAVGIFYLLLHLTQTSLIEASRQGWLLLPPSGEQRWQILNPLDFFQADWSIIIMQLDRAIPIFLLSILEVLLNSTAVELTVKKEMDLDQELKAFGLANLASALCGGLVGYHIVTGGPLLAHKLGAKSRLIGVIAITVPTAALVFGNSFISVLPKPLLGGLLMYLGLALLQEWVYKSWFKLSISDYFSVITIMIIVVTVGFSQGIFLGLIITIVIFVIKYSQLNIVRCAFSSATYNSNIERLTMQQQLLQQQGEQVYILQLQGFIFFGTGNQLLNHIRQRIINRNLEPLRFLVLDFHLVKGLDSSAVFNFVKLKQLVQQQQITLIFTSLPQFVNRSLRQSEVINTADLFCRVFPDLDTGIEWCENQILQIDDQNQTIVQPLPQFLKTFFSMSHVSDLMTNFKPLYLQPGSYLLRQGELSDGLYFIESGRVSVMWELPTGQTRRIRSYMGGSIVGETGLYQQTPQIESVVTDLPSQVYFLSKEAFDKLETKDPVFAAMFHKFIVNLLAERYCDLKTKMAKF